MMSEPVVELERGLRVVLRVSEPADEAYIKKTWKSVIIKHSPMWMRVDGDLQASLLNTITNWLYSRCDGALVACNPKDRWHVLGFCVGDSERKLVHFVHVLESIRHNGVGRLLMTPFVEQGVDGKPVIRCTAWTNVCERLQEKYDLRYFPSVWRKAFASRGRRRHSAATKP